MHTSYKTLDETFSHLTNSKQNADYQIISDYESLSAITGKMRDAAMLGDWDYLIDLEQQSNQAIAAMKLANAPTTLNAATRQHKIQFIKKILADDAAIRQRTELWMEQLQRIMQNNNQAQRLHQAYGT